MTACPCGSMPTLTESVQPGIRIMRLECACGRHGATLMYTRPDDRARIAQAAWDGWRLTVASQSLPP